MLATGHSEHQNWHIEFDFDRPGAYHMERDEQLAREYDGNVLRLYSWTPPAVSIGYQQKPESIDRDAAVDRGIDVVRRPTGGRAVLHWNELTYAVIVRSDPSSGIYAVHNTIVAVLLESLQPLGPQFKELTLTGGSSDTGFGEVYKPGTLTNAACFASTARHEVTWHGKKVIGSAQRRFGDVVLQHGSILLTTDHLQLPSMLMLSEEQRHRMTALLQRETATLSDVFDSPIDPNSAASAIASDFVSNFERISSSSTSRRPAALIL